MGGLGPGVKVYSQERKHLLLTEVVDLLGRSKRKQGGKVREHRVPIYDSEIGHIFTVEEDDVVFEGREELYTVLKALRNYGSPAARKLAKELWLLHTGLCKCDCCGRLTKELIYNSLVDSRGYSGVCRECDKSFHEECWKNMERGLGR